MSSSSPTTMTGIFELNSRIDIKSLHETVFIVNIYDESTGEQIIFNKEFVREDGTISKQRYTIPFYGHNGIIISSRFDNRARGIRQGGRTLNNVTAIDLQCCQKNIHFKISSSKFTGTGILSIEMAHEAGNILCSLINQLQKVITYVQTVPPDKFNYNLEWLANNCCTESGKLLKSSEIYNKFIENQSLDHELLNILSMYIEDNNIKNKDEYIRKIGVIRSIPNIIDEPLSYKSISFPNSAYMMHPKLSGVSLIKLSAFLLNRGYDSRYNNTKAPNEIKIFIPESSGQHVITVYKNINKNPEEYTISRTSPGTPEDSIKIYENVISDIYEFQDKYKHLSLAEIGSLPPK